MTAPAEGADAANPATTLRIQRCQACGNHQHYPRPMCLACGARDLVDVEASGAATVYSYTVVQRSPLPRFTAPYTVALVRLAEGPVVMSQVVDCAPEQVTCEMPVVLEVRRFDDGAELPVFRPVNPLVAPEP